jgi:hypothetical protein
MLSTESLRDQLDKYADDSLTSEAFEEWLASESWDMARWAPRGLQRLVEVLQTALIEYSDRKISAEQLRELLLQRRAQLHRAAVVTKSLQESRANLIEAMKRAQNQQESIAGTEALILQSSAA